MNFKKLNPNHLVTILAKYHLIGTFQDNPMIRPGSSIASITILNVPIHQVTIPETLAQIGRFLQTANLHQIATVNPEFVIAAQKDPEFLTVLRQADLCIPDGIGLLWAARIMGQRLPERVAGSELVYHLAELAAEKGHPLFLLGAAPGVAEAAAAVLQKRYPALIIAGTYAGSPDPAENNAIVQRINDSAATLLFVAYGAPKQDKWIARNKENLTTVRAAIGIGGSLDFITGRSVRAPQWMQRLGIEWLHRLYHEPWRWRRMLALPQFALRIIAARLMS
jgi:N-acetylglucosaminyldiphosphoundecaprenol N-acetyl-beta-D-mannosaminyltransferase